MGSLPIYRPLIAEIAAPTTATLASNVTASRVVRAVNTTETPYLVTIFGPANGGEDSATLTLTAWESVIIPKNGTDKIFAENAAIKLTGITDPNATYIYNK
jgi:hypothetical protein